MIYFKETGERVVIVDSFRNGRVLVRSHENHREHYEVFISDLKADDFREEVVLEIEKIEGCQRCLGSGWYSVPDSSGCVDWEQCGCEYSKMMQPKNKESIFQFVTITK